MTLPSKTLTTIRRELQFIKDNVPDAVIKASAERALQAAASAQDRCPKQWDLVNQINGMINGEGWGLFVFGDGMIVIDTDDEADGSVRKRDAYSYVEGRAAGGSLPHQIALGLHGMIMTEAC